MKRKLIAVSVMILALEAPLFGHRLDEYLQATMISVGKDSVHATMRLIPGVAVSSKVLTELDTNGDGILSETEQQAYASHVLRDVSLKIDGHVLSPTLLSTSFPKIDEMKEGVGEIAIEFAATLPRLDGQRSLVFENHHQSRVSAYLVNCLVPKNKDIQIQAQNRNENQSFYQLEYRQTGGGLTGVQALLARSVGFTSLFRLGMRHIAEGTDHLLFLLALLLPAPLLVFGARWAGPVTVRQGLVRILKVVTAFTLGHSATLALAALGVVRVPSRPIEILIAVSILISAIHALRPIFPGREAAIAMFFGLIHGLAFATVLSELQFGRWERVTGILAFNLGIETMQLVVVAATMPSLLLLSRTSAYPLVRIGGALFAGLASIGWIVERLLGIHNSVDVIVDGVAHHSTWLAAVLFAASLLAWRNYGRHQALRLGG